MNKTSKTGASPDYLRTSLAAAMTMRLRPGSFYRGARLHCLNLLLTYPEGCRGSCSYCGLSRDNASNRPSFIRVDWPTFPLDEIIAAVRAGDGSFERACISMIMHPSAVEDTITLTGRIREETGLPVSILVNPSTLHDGDLQAFLEAGADMAAVAIDAVTAELFDRHRGRGVQGPHRWENYWQTLAEAALVFGRGRAGAHLIAGLGETEEEMVHAMQRVHDLGGATHIFSFYPEPGSRLEEEAPCPASQFRRIQLARFLIDCNLAGADRMEFDGHKRLTGFGLKGPELETIVDGGEPFRTSGCPGRTRACACNRPYGDGPPGDIRSYPFRLEKRDVLQVRKQLATYHELPPRPVEETISLDA